MSNTRIPFREMRQTLTIVNAETAMLLALPNIEWKREEYAMFFIMNEMWRTTHNPTQIQMLTWIGACLRFLKKLIDQLPEENELRGNAQAEFKKIATDYESLLGAKES